MNFVNLFVFRIGIIVFSMITGANLGLEFLAGVIIIGVILLIVGSFGLLCYCYGFYCFARRKVMQAFSRFKNVFFL